MESAPRPVALGCLAVLALATTSGAECLPVEPGVYPFGSGSVEFLGCAAGVPEGGIVLEGAVEPTDVTATFTIALDPQSSEISGLGVTLRDPGTGLHVDPAGAGTVPDVGVEIAGIYRSTAPLVGESLHVVFSGDLHGGETSDPFFASYPTVPEGAQLTIFVCWPAMDGFGRCDAVFPEPVPEPRSGSLALAALAALVAAHRWRRKPPRAHMAQP